MKRTKRIQKLVMLIPLLLIVCFVIFPYIWTFLTSIKPTDELYTTNIKILPRETTFQNYVTLFTSTDFLASMFHSIVIAVITSCISMLVSSMASYAFARYRFRGKNLALSGILLLYMFPSVLYLTPLFVVFNKLKLIGSPVALVVSYCTFTIPFSIWLLTSYMKSIPLELEEAAIVDGCTRQKCFKDVLLPVSAPGLVTCSTLSFLGSWNNFQFALILSGEKTRTLPVSLQYFVSGADIRWGRMLAATIVVIVPTIILTMLLQKYIVQGMTAGAVKG